MKDDHAMVPAMVAMMREKLRVLTDKLLVLAKKKPTLVWAASFLLCLAVVLLNENPDRNIGGNSEEFIVGRVAERDVVADRDFSYVDETATRLRLEALERLIPAVFHYSSAISEELRSHWNRFVALAEHLSVQAFPQTFVLGIQAEFPGDFNDETLVLLYESEDLHEILQYCTIIFNTLLERGIFSMPQTGIEHLNPDTVEMIRQLGARIEQERFPIGSIITGNQSFEAIRAYIEASHYNPNFVLLAPDLLRPFLLPNVFHSPEDTERYISAIRLTNEPIMRHVGQGTHVIRRGFVITQEEMENFNALRMSLPGNNLQASFANTLFLLMLFILLYYFSGNRIIGRKLRDSEVYLVSGLTVLYITGAVLVRNVYIMSIPAASILVPTALIIMLNTILIHPRFALLLAFALPLGAFLTGSFDSQDYFFALVSGVVAAYSLQGAEKRMDLVKAGLVIATANIVAMTAVLLWQNSSIGLYPLSLFWAAFNGIASGMLVLGVLSPLEHVLKAATSFRLIELSDLNAPILRRLFTTAPGTYSHSIMVANLAETACLDIGANPLLARVGAYYHDLGKMENPDYFVENQTGYNRHDDMAPRLSATVIRSHVKLGVEKARQLGLPQEVIDIVGEHHGNSVIVWFYDKALKQEDPSKAAVNMEDFSYPGNPPQSRESAVVMLADVAEAAVRTLEKPNAGKIEKFIQELIGKKVEHGQLAQSELTFRDLEVIKNAFVRVLTGYYHSRIEYPKLDIETLQNETKNGSIKNGSI